MKILFILFAFNLSFSLTIQSQQHRIDSLEKLLTSANAENRIAYFNALSAEYQSQENFEESLEYVRPLSSKVLSLDLDSLGKPVP